MSETTEKTTRPPLSADARQAALDKQNVNARKQFTEKFEGTILKIPTQLHCREVIRAYKRIFHISQRNWWIATNTPRTQLKDAELAMKVESGMLKKIEEATKFFQGQLDAGEFKAKEAGADLSLVSHGVSFSELTPVVGPVSMKLRQLFILADKFLDMSAALYAFSEIDGTEANKNKYDVKTKLDAVATSIRNFRMMALAKVNEAGKGRAGFKAVHVDGELAGEVKADGDKGSANVVAIADAGGAAAAVSDGDDADASTETGKAAAQAA